jgi:hypothetical protein
MLEFETKGKLMEKMMGLMLAELKEKLMGNLGLDSWKERQKGNSKLG